MAELAGHGDPGELLARFGRNPFSVFVRYEARWRWIVGREGAAAFLEHGRVALVWADPLGSDPADVLDELTRRLRAEHRIVCLLLIGQEVAELARAGGYAVLKIGEQPFFDLASWQPPRGDPGKHLRWCLNRARRAAVRVDAYEPHHETAVLEALGAWRDALGRPSAESFLRASPLTLAGEKRLFCAWQDGRVEAVLACTPVPAVRGWLLEDLIRRPDAPVGATEAVVVHALQSLATDGAAGAWMDLAPLRGAESQIDRRARFILRLMQPAVAWFDRRYRFRALTSYLGKFQPTSWTPRYVALNPALPTPSLVRAVRALL